MLKLVFAVGQILIQIFEISFPLGTTSQKKIIELSEKGFVDHMLAWSKVSGNRVPTLLLEPYILDLKM